jgi:hypothetical protein
MIGSEFARTIIVDKPDVRLHSQIAKSLARKNTLIFNELESLQNSIDYAARGADIFTSDGYPSFVVIFRPIMCREEMTEYLEGQKNVKDVKCKFLECLGMWCITFVFMIKPDGDC